jgi:hypothetical protein
VAPPPFHSRSLRLTTPKGTYEWFKGSNGKLLPGPTIFDQLDSANASWGYYFQTTPWELYMQSVFVNAPRLRHYSEFLARAEAGTLPRYSWINPRSGIENATDVTTSIPTTTFLWARRF